MVQVASRTKLEVCVDHDFMDAHLLVKLNVDQMWLRPIGPAGVQQVSVRAEERQGWPGTHCQYVSILSSRNCSTPLPGFAVESDQTAMAPISRSSDDLLSICRALYRHIMNQTYFSKNSQVVAPWAILSHEVRRPWALHEIIWCNQMDAFTR